MIKKREKKIISTSFESKVRFDRRVRKTLINKLRVFSLQKQKFEIFFFVFFFTKNKINRNTKLFRKPSFF